jgi:Zn-dependent metalloprotease
MPCFFVPPYILDALETSGDPLLREHAARTKSLTLTLSRERTLFAEDVRSTTHAHAGHPDVRRVFDARHGTSLPGALKRDEGDAAVRDAAVNEAYAAAGATWAFYREVFARDSIDDRGEHLISSVHYDRHYDNAFWNGAQMVYGDGDGVIFGGFTHCIDVIAHELTHGVTMATCDLAYDDQPGALNESLSDVFGSMVKQYTLGQSAHDADWLIGAGLMLPATGIRALRSLAAPGTAYDDSRLGGRDPQPAHMRDYYDGAADNYGVHINSGIPNHAFYLVATALGGRSWERAGAIWYRALTSGLSSQSTFRMFADATIAAAVMHDAPVVRRAWKAVGVH